MKTVLKRFHCGALPRSLILCWREVFCPDVKGDNAAAGMAGIGNSFSSVSSTLMAGVCSDGVPMLPL